MTSFYNGVSGIKTHQSGIDVWGNNIANVNTVGYKANIPEFATLFSTAVGNLTSSTTNDLGMGSKLQSTAISLEQGPSVATEKPFDLAINGEGWFMVSNTSGTFYTRNGSFTKDADGYIIDNGGNRLMGTPANNITDGMIAKNITKLPFNETQEPLLFPANLSVPHQPTTVITVKRNLDSQSPLVQYIKSEIITAEGEKVPVKMAFSKQDPQPAVGTAWNVVAGYGVQKIPAETVSGTTTRDASGAFTTPGEITIGGQTINYEAKLLSKLTDDPSLGGFVTQSSIIDAYGDSVPVSLIFKKTTPQPTTGSSWNVTAKTDLREGPLQTATSTAVMNYEGALVTAPALSIGGATIDFGSYFSGLTATTASVTGEKVTQNGKLAGMFSGFSVDNGGNIVANFNNDTVSIIGRIAVVHFQNDQGLDKIGDTLFNQSSNSGEPIMYKDAQGETFLGSSIVDYTLESSNVNIGQALTELIILQKAYDANAKSITTSDQMLKTVLGLHR